MGITCSMCCCCTCPRFATFWQMLNWLPSWTRLDRIVQWDGWQQVHAQRQAMPSSAHLWHGSDPTASPARGTAQRGCVTLCAAVTAAHYGGKNGGASGTWAETAQALAAHGLRPALHWAAHIDCTRWDPPVLCVCLCSAIGHGTHLAGCTQA